MSCIRKLLKESVLNELVHVGQRKLELQVRGIAQTSTGNVPHRRKKPSLAFRVRKSFRTDESKPNDPRPLYTGVILERYPICFQEPAAYKVQHDEWSLAWNAWKYRQVPDELLSGDKQNVDETSEEAKFKPEPVITEADHANDIRSLRRNTQGYLYLACKDSNSGKWQIPQTKVHSSESIRDAAQRCIKDMVGDSIDTFFFGNVPAAHIETDDARIFFMLGVVLDGDVELESNSPAADFAWLRKSELAKSFTSDEKMSALLDTLAVEPNPA